MGIENINLSFLLFSQDKIDYILDNKIDAEHKDNIVSSYFNLSVDDIILMSKIKRLFLNKNNLNKKEEILEQIPSLFNELDAKVKKASHLKTNIYYLYKSMLYIALDKIYDAYKYLNKAYAKLSTFKDRAKLTTDEISFFDNIYKDLFDLNCFCALSISSQDFDLSYKNKVKIFLKSLESNLSLLKELISSAPTRFKCKENLLSFEDKFTKLSLKISLFLDKCLEDKIYRLEFFENKIYLTLMPESSYLNLIIFKYIKDNISNKLSLYFDINIGINNHNLFDLDFVDNLSLPYKEDSAFSKDKLLLLYYPYALSLIKDKSYKIYYHKKNLNLSYDYKSLYIYKGTKEFVISLDDINIKKRDVVVPFAPFYLNKDLDILSKEIKSQDKIMYDLIFDLTLKNLNKHIQEQVLRHLSFIYLNEVFCLNNVRTYKLKSDCDESLDDLHSSISLSFDDRDYVNYLNMCIQEDRALNKERLIERFNYKSKTKCLFNICNQEIYNLLHEDSLYYDRHISYLKMNVFFGTLSFKVHEIDKNKVLFQDEIINLEFFAPLLLHILKENLEKINFNVLSLNISSDGYIYIDAIIFDMLILEKVLDNILQDLSIVSVHYTPFIKRAFHKEIYLNQSLYQKKCQQGGYLININTLRSHINAYRSLLKPNLKENILNILTHTDDFTLSSFLNENTRHLLFNNIVDDVENDDYFSLLKALEALAKSNTLALFQGFDKDKLRYDFVYKDFMHAISLMENLCLRNNYYFNFFILSLLYTYIGNIERARFAIEKALNLNNKAYLCYYLRAFLNYITNADTKALEDIDKSIELYEIKRNVDLKQAILKHENPFLYIYKNSIKNKEKDFINVDNLSLSLNFKKEDELKRLCLLALSTDKENLEVLKKELLLDKNSFIANYSCLYINNCKVIFSMPASLLSHFEKDFIEKVKSLCITKNKDYIDSNDNSLYKLFCIEINIYKEISFIYTRALDKDTYIYKVLDENKHKKSFYIRNLPIIDDINYKERLHKLNLVLENERNKLNANDVTNDSNIIRLVDIAC